MDAQYLRSTKCIDSAHPAVQRFAKEVTAEATTDLDRAIALYYAVRDCYRYDPYRVDLSVRGMRASAVIEREYGFCIPKATLLAAAARHVGIPSRLGFADVKNHLATEKLLRLMQTDLFVFHGYAELWLNGQWVKATPAFNKSLCERFNVASLEFDGRHDSLFQQFNQDGDRYMEYIRDRGQFDDVPLAEIVEAFRKHYPAMMAGAGYDVGGRFEDEAGP